MKDSEIKIVVGGSNFEEFVTNKMLLVDKTLLIKEIIDGGHKVLLITRPRRWGKTLNMSMLEYFFSIPTQNDGSVDKDKFCEKKEIFSKMNISEHPEIIQKYCGQYPTLFVSFKDIKESTYESIKRGIQEVIYRLYSAHAYLQYSQKLSDLEKSLFREYLSRTALNEVQLGNSLLYLSQMLQTHFDKKVMILIDEYDTPMNDWYERSLVSKKTEKNEDRLLQEILDLFRNIFGAALKDNSHLEKSVITGILRIAKASLFSGLNNLGEDSILDHRYAHHFGFTEKEVHHVLYALKKDNNITAMQQLKNWYNGYNIGGVTIYNPWSIMNYLSTNGEMKPYWIGTASTELIEHALILDKFQEEVQSLIEGEMVSVVVDPKMVFTDIKTSPDALNSLLLFSGYLTAEYIHQNFDASYSCQVRLPNNEIRGFFSRTVQKWIGQKFNIEAGSYQTFIEHLVKGEMDIFIGKLREYLKIAASFYSTGEKKVEVFYNGFMIGLITSVSQNYTVESEKESGKGLVDLVLIPKKNAPFKNALLIEIKIAGRKENLKIASKQALMQIHEKKYDEKIQIYEDVKKVIRVGLAFCGKEVEMAWKED